MITGSIVTYKNEFEKLVPAIYSFLNTSLPVHLYIVDNSPDDEIRKLCYSDKITYIHTGSNVGFGKGHNLILKKIIESSTYHLVLNPDVYFEESDVIQELKTYMDANPKVGLVMPKILNTDGSIQYNCKLLPTPFNLIIRRFLNFSQSLVKKSNYYYEMQFSDYEHEMEVPYLSGCFMFLRVEALKEVGFFDDSFFLYGEDIDMSRRIHEKFRTIYLPTVSIYHHHEKGSYKSFLLMLYNVQSAIIYFNKWGWWDKERRSINRAAIGQASYAQSEV